jgi:hypothetical protein
MRARFPIGLTFIRHIGKKVHREETILDILTTTNTKGEVVRIEYLIAHDFLGQKVTETVVDTTIARNLAPEVLAKFCS